MSLSPPVVNDRELDNGGDSNSSRESGIGDPPNEAEQVPENGADTSSKTSTGEGEDDEYYEDEGCRPNLNLSFGDGGVVSFSGSSDGDAASREVDTSPCSRDKEDVKKLTGFDAAGSQQRRRLETLQMQRERRDEILDKIRQLEDSAYSDSETEDEMDFAESVRRTGGQPPCVQTLEEIFEEGACAEQMEVLVPNKNKSKQNKSNRRNRQNKGGSANRMDTTTSHSTTPVNYGNHSHYNRRQRYRQTPCRPMLSEWLLERPDDFDDMWLGVICPAGKRVIVMASRGKTKIFSRKDEYLGSYKSLLPGGCRYNYRDTTTNRNRGVTILDCIWSQQSQTFYVLDMLCWNSHSCVNCDTDYRQFFLTSKFSENLELLERSPSNPFPFKPLPYFRAAEMSLVLWSSIAFPEAIDGILFFHREAFYICETNPLCLWIVLTQVESILDTQVSPELLSRQVKVKNLSSRKKQQRIAQQTKQSRDQNLEMEVALS